MLSTGQATSKAFCQASQPLPAWPGWSPPRSANSPLAFAPPALTKVQLWHLFLGPGASTDEINYLMEMQKRSATPDVAYAYYRSLAEREQGFELARQIEVPTLILHPKDDQMVPYENSLDLASVIPGAKLKTVEGDCHYVMLDTKRSQSADFVAAVEEFLAN